MLLIEVLGLGLLAHLAPVAHLDALQVVLHELVRVLQGMLCCIKLCLVRPLLTRRPAFHRSLADGSHVIVLLVLLGLRWVHLMLRLTLIVLCLTAHGAHSAIQCRVLTVYTGLAAFLL